MFCKKCGSDVGESKFCPSCGEAVDSVGPAAGEKFIHPGKRVNKLAYALIAIFFGSFGIHRFYAGKIVSGIVYLLFCWTGIPGILGLIEGILALCRDNEDDGGNIPVDEKKFFV